MSVTFMPAAVLLCAIGQLAAAEPAEKPAVKVEIRLAETKAAEGLTEAKVSGTDTKVYLHKEVVATNKDIATALVEDTDQPSVEVTFTKEGQKKMAKATADHKDKPLAILVDGKVIFAPIVRDKIAGAKARISLCVGTKAEAERIAKGLQGK
jgi:preprotein translocase subunit SecD